MNEKSEDFNDFTFSRTTVFSKVFCELTGGHKNKIIGSYQNGKIRRVSLFCHRCKRQTKFYDIPNEEPENI